MRKFSNNENKGLVNSNFYHEDKYKDNHKHNYHPPPDYSYSYAYAYLTAVIKVVIFM